MPFTYVRYCACVAEWCIWLSSIFFSYWLWDHSNSVWQCPNVFQYCSSISECCPEDETLQTQSGGGQHAVIGGTVLNVPQQILVSPVKSSCHLSEETGMSYSSCERGTPVLWLWCPRPPTSRYVGKSGLLLVFASICFPKPLHLGHDMVFLWSFVSPTYVNSQHIRMWAATISEDSSINRKWACGVICHLTT